MMLGLFGLFGFCALLGAKATLLIKIIWSKNCSGISGKTQILYTLVFGARYLDLASSYYNYPTNVSISKISLLLMTYSIVLSIFFFYYDSYQAKYDRFRLELLLLPSLVLALLANYGFEINDVFWAFSVYLEAMAIIPQIYLVAQTGRIDNAVYVYVSLLTLYKSFHVMNEMYNHFYAAANFDRISLAAGVVQLMLYCDLFTRELHQATDDAPAATEQQHQQQELQPGDIHPKEAEAMRSAMEAARLQDNLREIVLCPGGFMPDTAKPADVPPSTEPRERKPNLPIDV